MQCKPLGVPELPTAGADVSALQAREMRSGAGVSLPPDLTILDTELIETIVTIRHTTVVVTYHHGVTYRYSYVATLILRRSARRLPVKK